MASLRRFITSLLPWYDEREAEAEAEKTDAVIQRSVRHRERNDRLLQAAFIAIERRHGDAVRADYRRADDRIRGR